MNSTSPVYAILRNTSMVDYPGRLSMVMFLSGCNFSCGFCHNAVLRHPQQDLMTWDRLEKSCREYRLNWVDAAVITGGEATLSNDLSRLIDLLKAQGFSVKLDTNGGLPDVLEKELPRLDYVAMDVKCSPEKYPELTGFSDTSAIARSIELLKSKAADYEFRTTIVEPFHTDDEMRRLGEWIRGAKRYAIQPYVPRDGVLDETIRQLPRTTPARLKQLGDLMRPYVQTLEIRGA
ncbi:MAG TPA: anaerobic ribonucleoside-triphosphate reductase activating protein [Verrucomicrobia bacterium]|nr:MAG: anaerobic ribonucleoside-triphosphate reductase activating protein [Lentisphaerae bacterium GWF2_57_35]HBA83775.1 anaerobic ribonucleoside-triphosphate reductase activating protein [Verrucomicrobiota bacterium]